MRCIPISTANSYDLQGLALSLKEVEYINFYTDSLHIAYEEGNIFVFSYGCAVFWNLTEDQEEEFIKHLNGFADQLIPTLREEFTYSFATKPRFFQDKITLAKTRAHALQMLAVSYGLSQSSKLAYFEERINKTIAQTKMIPQELAEKGKISLSQKAISRRIGALFIERNSINLHTDILDAPVFIWDHPEYEGLYTMTILDLELHARTAVLNRRLDIIKELFEMMRDELANRHSVMLEFVVILLIAMEVFLTIVIHIFHLF